MNSIEKRPFAVVTGASSGIGQALGRQFAQHGYDLLIGVEPGVSYDGADAEFRALGASVTVATADLATPDGVETLARAIEETGRPIDAIAINAGVGVGGDFRDTDLASELRLIDLNCKSTVHLAKRVVPAMSARGEGRILFTSSIAAMMPDPFEAVYGASKAFVYSFAQALRDELKDSGVTVTALQPGPTETNFFHRAEMDDTSVGSEPKDDADEVAAQAFAGLMAGRDHVVAGSLKTRVQAAVIKNLPEGIKSAVHRSMAEPGSAKN